MERERCQNQVMTGPPPKRTPRWKRELRILRRDGLVRYVRGAWQLRRFNRSVRKMDRANDHTAKERV